MVGVGRLERVELTPVNKEHTPVSPGPTPLSFFRSATSPATIRISTLPHLPSSQGISYVSRRRMDDADFDPDAVDEEGLPLVYNEKRIAAFWGNRPGELFGRWTRFTAISGEGGREEKNRTAGIQMKKHSISRSSLPFFPETAPWLTKMANAVLQGKVQERQVRWVSGSGVRGWGVCEGGGV